MVDGALFRIISKLIEKGADDKQIVTALKLKGYTEEKILEALKKTVKHEHPKEEEKKHAEPAKKDEEPKPKIGEPKKPALPKNMITTDIDRLYELVKEKNAVKISAAAKELGISSKVIEKWGSILESSGMVKMHYPAVGEAELVIAND